MPTISTEGRHAVQVTAANVTESTNGTPCVELLFRAENGDTITGWFYLSEKAFERTLTSLREAFGFDGVFERFAEQCEGKACSITTEIESDEKGRERLRVRWLNGAKRAVKPIQGGSSALALLSKRAKMVPMTPAGIEAAREARPAPAPRPRPTPDATPDATSDDNVPF